MIASFDELISSVKGSEQRRIAVASVSPEEVELAVCAFSMGIAHFSLIGDKQIIVSELHKHSADISDFDIHHETDPQTAARIAVEMVVEGKADLPMKGLMQTGSFFRAVLNKQNGLATSRRISQITVFAGYNGGLQMLTDCAINISPNLEEKVSIIENAVSLAHQLGIAQPKVALLGAVETVSQSMPDTMEAAVLTQMNRRGQIKGCIIDGPLSLDNAICSSAAAHKGIDSPVAGKADILVTSELREANTLSKSLHYYADRQTASAIIGTAKPIIMTSRTDKMENKINSIALSCYLTMKEQNK